MSLAGTYRLVNWLFRAGVHHAPGDIVELSHEDGALAQEHKTAVPVDVAPCASEPTPEPATSLTGDGPAGSGADDAAPSESKAEAADSRASQQTRKDRQFPRRLS